MPVAIQTRDRWRADSVLVHGGPSSSVHSVQDAACLSWPEISSATHSASLTSKVTRPMGWGRYRSSAPWPSRSPGRGSASTLRNGVWVSTDVGLRVDHPPRLPRDGQHVVRV